MGRMATIVTLPEPTYITVALVKSMSRNLGLSKQASVEDIKYLIQVSEGQIDDYVGPQLHHPDDTNEHRVFPRMEDENDAGTVIIPLKVTEACLAQVQWLYEQWMPTIAEDSNVPVEHDVKAHAMSDSGAYNSVRTAAGIDFASATLCEAAKAKLTSMRSSTARLGLSSVEGGPLPRSSRDNYLTR